jgi:hypothetical protein
MRISKPRPGPLSLVREYSDERETLQGITRLSLRISLWIANDKLHLKLVDKGGTTIEGINSDNLPLILSAIKKPMSFFQTEEFVFHRFVCAEMEFLEIRAKQAVNAISYWPEFWLRVCQDLENLDLEDLPAAARAWSELPYSADLLNSMSDKRFRDRKKLPLKETLFMPRSP